MSDFILSFSSTETRLDRVGGKGMNLADLARSGFRVPPGFLVTTDAYAAFVQANGLYDRIMRVAAAVSPDDPVALENASAEIRALFDRGQMPGDIAGEIDTAYAGLCGDSSRGISAPLAVAVRSSATAEDLPGLAFAGQQDTYLNIIGTDAVRESVKKCWGSLWTARAMAYRARNHIPPEHVALAVVVQAMVPSESSGVLFTANPLTGRRDEIVLDASFGLGEAIVSGQVDPDHYTVDPHEWKITQRVLGDKALAIVPRAGGGTTRVEQAGTERQALPDAQILELAKTAARVAEHFGSPQDIEWAWANQTLYLLQSRPITSLYPLPEGAPQEGLRVYISLNSIQGVVDPLTPLGLNTLQMIGRGVLAVLGARDREQAVVLEAGRRLYIDLTTPVADPRLRRVVLAVLARGDPGAREAMVKLIDEGRLPVRQVLHLRSLFTPSLFRQPVPRRVLAGIRAPEKTIAAAVAEAEAFIKENRSHLDAAHGLAEQLAVMEQDIPRAFTGIVLGLGPLIFPAFVLLALVDRRLVEWLGEPKGAALALLRGIPGNVTTEMDLKLWSIARAVRADPAAADALRTATVPDLVEAYGAGTLPAVAQRGVAGFMDEYGMRGVAEIDLGRARWRDDPTYILQTVRNYLLLEDPHLAPDVVFDRGAEEANRLAVDYAARLRKKPLGSIRARVLTAAIRRMRLLNAVREAPKFYMVQLFSAYRAAFLESGRELAKRGILERAEDIFFVPLAQLKEFADGQPVDLKEIVARERAGYEQEFARKLMPRLLLSTGEAFYEGVSAFVEGDGDAATGADLAGDPVSPGVAEGRVRVVMDPSGVRLEPGEILVCRATDPGWTPLFLTAGGLVMEVGGLVTHGAVVAREYGIPAVVGVHQATTRLETGQRVRVDGTNGRVTVLT